MDTQRPTGAAAKRSIELTVAFLLVATTPPGCANSVSRSDDATARTLSADRVVTAADTTLDKQIDILGDRIAESLIQSGVFRIAVADFSGLDGDAIPLGQYLAEELTTRLSKRGAIEVVERRLLDQWLSEHRLRETGIIDSKAATAVGLLLGVDGIATGTVVQLGDEVRVNARIVSTDTGRTLGAARVAIPKSLAIDHLLKPTERSSPKSKPTPMGSRLTFFENFSDVPEGRLPNGWVDGDHLAVSAKAGRNHLAPFESAAEYRIVTPEIEFPDNFRLQVVIRVGRPRVSVNHYSIRSSNIDAGFSVFNQRDGTTIWLGRSKTTTRSLWGREVSVSIERECGVVRLAIDAEQLLIRRDSMSLGSTARLTLQVRHDMSASDFEYVYGTDLAMQDWMDFSIYTLEVSELDFNRSCTSTAR